jgi:hypothetical protein
MIAWSTLLMSSTTAIQDRDNLREQIELAEDFRHHLQQQIEVNYLQL